MSTPRNFPLRNVPPSYVLLGVSTFGFQRSWRAWIRANANPAWCDHAGVAVYLYIYKYITIHRTCRAAKIFLKNYLTILDAYSIFSLIFFSPSDTCNKYFPSLEPVTTFSLSSGKFYVNLFEKQTWFWTSSDLSLHRQLQHTWRQNCIITK